jgi:hypothetical protein
MLAVTTKVNAAKTRNGDRVADRKRGVVESTRVLQFEIAITYLNSKSDSE